MLNPQLAKFKSDLVSIGKMVVNSGHMSMGLVENDWYLQWLFMVICYCNVVCSCWWLCVNMFVTTMRLFGDLC